MARLTGENLSGWKLLRVKPNNAGPGTFVNDTAHAANNTAINLAESVGITAQQSSSSEATKKLHVLLVAVDTSDVPVNRGALTVNVQVVESCGVTGDESSYGGVHTFVADGPAATGVTLNDVTTFDVPTGTYTVTLNTFVAVPVTANEIRIYVKVS